MSTSIVVSGGVPSSRTGTGRVSRPTGGFTRGLSPRQARRVSVVSHADDGTRRDTRNSEAGIYMRQLTETESEAEVIYIAGMLKLWLDDEWSVQQPHTALGLQAANKCVAMRLKGCEEMGSLVMGVQQDLLSFDFSDTFVNSFEVANKTSEILMMKEGYEVCCLSKEDETRQARYDEMIAKEAK
jgi:hypothetical protein